MCRASPLRKELHACRVKPYFPFSTLQNESAKCSSLIATVSSSCQYPEEFICARRQFSSETRPRLQPLKHIQPRAPPHPLGFPSPTKQRRMSVILVRAPYAMLTALDRRRSARPPPSSTCRASAEAATPSRRPPPRRPPPPPSPPPAAAATRQADLLTTNVLCHDTIIQNYNAI